MLHALELMSNVTQFAGRPRFWEKMRLFFSWGDSQPRFDDSVTQRQKYQQQQQQQQKEWKYHIRNI